MKRKVFQALAGVLAAMSLAMPMSTLASPKVYKTPFWGSLTDPKVNMRLGPGEDYGIRFEYHRKLLPVRVLRIWQGWAFVEDPDGAKGWMLLKFAVGPQTAVVKGKRGGVAPVHEAPDAGSRVLWRLAPGVVGRVSSCEDGWCRFDVEGRVGFVRSVSLWGATAP
ncbi:hypothetical protein GTZ99_05930 [Novosphingobium sp. FSY-8]|uniref:SH3-like domain-containing protein n=1 Tax=Novosphingobium ovatum TaxID=1908523 RepID=A0ABW9XC42_9SPHN|nr:SH3 domain-containing protein [Novosphingobium ovatum]NBC36095.1 hypothetical protein [Novosphingobium ovatum]